MSDYDAIIIGSGHNGLICAAYLAKAGYRVCVLERRHTIGGAITTDEVFEGYKIDLGGSGHFFIHLTPILNELQLAQYGLDYIEIDPMFFVPTTNGKHFFMWRDVDKTCESIAQISAYDAEQYRKFHKDWSPIALAFFEMMQTEPNPLHLLNALRQGLAKQANWQMQRFWQMRWSLRQLLNYYFESDEVKGAMGWLAVQSGWSLDQAGSAFVGAWHTLYHHTGLHFPRGGSMQLAVALKNLIENHDGVVLTEQDVSTITIHNEQVVDVLVTDGTRYATKMVVAGCHYFTTVKLLGESAPKSMMRKRKSLKVSNGLGVALRLATSALPTYQSYQNNDRLANIANQLLSPSLNYINTAWQQYEQGNICKKPAIVVSSYSAVDDSITPDGKYSVSIWAQYFPYHLAFGASWEQMCDIASQYILDVFEQYVPEFRQNILEMKIQSPVDLERELGLVQGDLQHLRLTPNQMFVFRPSWQLSRYKTPIKGLYLTGASTHPGGGIMGLAGYLSAHRILADMAQND